MSHNYVPPMFIFPKVHFKKHMLTGAATVSTGHAKPTSWWNERVFITIWSILLLCKEDPVLLILDSYESRLAIPIINTTKEDGSIALHTLLPHTSHTLQPLDCTIFGPYKTHYNACLNEWMMSNPDKPVNNLQCCRHYSKIFRQGIYQTQHWKGVSCDRNLSPKWKYFWCRLIPILLCHEQTLQSDNRTSHCTFKLQGQYWKRNINWIYTEHESNPWNSKTLP